MDAQTPIELTQPAHSVSLVERYTPRRDVPKLDVLISFRVDSDFASMLRDLRKQIGASSDADAARYAMSAGLAALAPITP